MTEIKVMDGVYMTLGSSSNRDQEFIKKVETSLSMMGNQQEKALYLQNMIATLENSIEKLNASQDELREALESSPEDVDFKQALDENEKVIAKQQTQIVQLKTKLQTFGHVGGIESSSSQAPKPKDSSEGLYL